MTTVTTLEEGRKAFRKQAWADAYALLSSADTDLQVDPEDLKNLATAAYLTGKETDCAEIWARAHQGYLENGEVQQAVNCAFWLGLILLIDGDRAQGSGWIARASRLIKRVKGDCVEKGFLLIPKALQHLRNDNAESAFQLFSKAGKIGTRCSSQDLITLSRLGRGQSLIQKQKVPRGTTLLDEAMVAVIAGETSPIVTGIVYCAVIETCQKIYDLRRAQEWTEALSRWCESHPTLVPFRGQCLIRRAEIMQLHGDWENASQEIHRAGELLSRENGKPAAGEAFYQQAELQRLQGNFAKAEEIYRKASKLGRKPQPGLALLRMAQGETNAAETAIRRVEKEKKGAIERSKVLPAFIEIMLSVGDIESAETGAKELAEIATSFEAPFLQAIASRAEGDILLTDNKASAALDKLLDAWSTFKRMSAFYESAQTRVLIGLAYRQLGDDDTAEIELDAARWKFQQLGAAYDVSKVNSLRQDASGKDTHGLTQRELEVLHHLTTGKTNKEIGSVLYISERTVDRHVSNILSKLNVPSRAAATAYAYKHNIS